MFKKLRVQAAMRRLFEEQVYEIVLAEINRGERRDGIYAKALIDSEGDKNKARSLYIKYRAEALKDEVLIKTTVEDWLRDKESVRLNDEAYPTYENTKNTSDFPNETSSIDHDNDFKGGVWEKLNIFGKLFFIIVGVFVIAVFALALAESYRQ